MYKYRFGVIVPVYKVEKHLEKCVNSILDQSFKDFKVVLIDDGSPDKCPMICDNLSSKHNNIICVHQENKGVTKARENGINNAFDCEFIVFVDSDDTIPYRALEIYNEIIKNNNVDIVIGSYSNNRLQYKEGLIDINYYRGASIRIGEFHSAPWGKAFKRTLFNNNIFSIPRSITFGEDTIMNIRLSFETKKNVYVTQECVYNYIEHDNSAVKTFKPTIDYFSTYSYYLYESIPQQYIKYYINDYIKTRFDYLEYYYLLRYNENNYYNSKFYKDIIRDIEQYNYKLELHKRLLIQKNYIVRLIVLFIRNTYAYLHSFLK